MLACQPHTATKTRSGRGRRDRARLLRLTRIARRRLLLFDGVIGENRVVAFNHYPHRRAVRPEAAWIRLAAAY